VHHYSARREHRIRRLTKTPSRPREPVETGGAASLHERCVCFFTYAGEFGKVCRFCSCRRQNHLQARKLRPFHRLQSSLMICVTPVRRAALGRERIRRQRTPP
jgi:hypothetical protein